MGLTNVCAPCNPNAIPAPGSELINSADFSSPKLAPSFFEVVTYRGAFDPNLSLEQQWTACWTNFCPQDFWNPATDVAQDGRAPRAGGPSPLAIETPRAGGKAA